MEEFETWYKERLKNMQHTGNTMSTTNAYLLARLAWVEGMQYRNNEKAKPVYRGSGQFDDGAIVPR